MVFTKATGLLMKMYFSKFFRLWVLSCSYFCGSAVFFCKNFPKSIFLPQFDILNIFFKKFFLRKYALTAKYLKAENLPVIIFEKFKISDLLKNQNIIFDDSNLLTVKKPLLVGELEDLLMI